MSDTPETDLMLSNQLHDCVPFDESAKQLADLACKLERERDEANKELHKQLAKYDALFDEAEKIRTERDEARDTVSRLRKQRAIARNFGDQMERERDELRADKINHENLSMRYMDERDEAREAFAVATSNCVDAQQQLRTARNLADAATWEADRLRSKLEKLVCERDEARLQYSTTLVFCQSLVKARMEEIEAQA